MARRWQRNPIQKRNLVQAPRCTCAGRSPRCTLCVDLAMRRHGGVADEAGRQWALRVAKATYEGAWPPPQPWPAREGKVAEIADRLVRGLVGDARIREMLASRCYVAARRQWQEWRGEVRGFGAGVVVGAVRRPPWLVWDPAKHAEDPAAFKAEQRRWRQR